MQIRVKLMGALKKKEPVDGFLDVPEASSLEDILSQLAISPEQVQIVMVNNRPQPDRTALVQADDELTILAPVVGG